MTAPSEDQAIDAASAATYPVDVPASAAMQIVEKRKRGRPPKVRPVVFQEAPSAPDTVLAVAAEEPAAQALSALGNAARSVKAVTSPAVTSDPLSALPEPAAAIAEGFPSVATIAPNPADTFNVGADKFSNVFGDVGTRLKTGFEKSSKLGEEMIDLAKGNAEAVVASAKVAAKGGEALGQDVAAYGKKSFESAVAAMKSFASVKSPTELFQLQSEFAKASFDSAVAEASKFSESMMKLAGDVAQPLSTRYAVAAEKIKANTL